MRLIRSYDSMGALFELRNIGRLLVVYVIGALAGGILFVIGAWIYSLTL